MQEKTKKRGVLRRLFFNRSDERAYGRFAFFFDTLMMNFSNIFANGAFYTAFLRLNNISMADVGIMTYMPIIANLSCIFSPFIFRKKQKRKALLMSARMAYFMLNLVGVALVPFLVTNAGVRIFLMCFFLSSANVIWGLFVGGFSDWMLNFLPLDGTREDFFGYQSLICSVMAAVTQIGAGAVATAIETLPDAAQNSWLFWLRVGGFVFILLDVLVFLRVKEYPYPQSDVRLKIKDIVVLPMRHKPFRTVIFLRAAMTLSLAITSSSWTYYLLDCGLKYSTLSFLGAIPPFLSLFFTPIALRLFKRLGCVNDVFLLRRMELLMLIGYVFVTPVTVHWLYPIVFILYQVLSVGMSIADSNFAYLFMPEKDRLTYYSFYYSISTIASFLGAFIGAQYISLTQGRGLTVLGISLSNVQLLMVIQAAFFSVFIVALGFMRKRLAEEEKAITP